MLFAGANDTARLISLIKKNCPIIVGLPGQDPGRPTGSKPVGLADLLGNLGKHLESI